MTAEPVGGFRARYPAEHRFGKLEWLGGLVLSSGDPRFGGFSGLLSLDGGARILSVSDRGNWFSAQLAQKPSGELIGAGKAFMAPMLDERGVSLSDKHRGDAEGLTRLPGGAADTVFVSFEQRHRVLAWAMSGHVPQSRARAVPAPRQISQLDDNKGLEALAASAADGPLKGAFVAIAERDPEGGDSNPGWIFSKGKPRSFRLRQSDGYDVTDAAFLPGGDLLVLERRFNLRYGLGMRIRRIALGDLVAGGTLDGALLMEADLRHQIDNMEGLAVHQNVDGETILTLISDDNQLVLQRSLLLRFKLIETAAEADSSVGIGLPRSKP